MFHRVIRDYKKQLFHEQTTLTHWGALKQKKKRWCCWWWWWWNKTGAGERERKRTTAYMTYYLTKGHKILSMRVKGRAERGKRCENGPIYHLFNFIHTVIVVAKMKKIFCLNVFFLPLFFQKKKTHRKKKKDAFRKWVMIKCLTSTNMTPWMTPSM